MVAQTPQIPILHYNKTLHVLLAILLFVAVVGGVIIYQLYNAPAPEDASVPSQDLGVTQAQRDAALVALKARIDKNPPISQSQRDKALQDLKKRVSQ